MDVPVGPLPRTSAHEQGGNVRLMQFLKSARHHWWLILLCTIVLAAAAFLYGRTVTKTYTAANAITVEGDKFAIPELQGALRSANAPDPMPWVRTEVQALTSRALIQSVSLKLGLDKDPEFNAALRPPTLMQSVKSFIQSLLPQSPDTGPAAGPDEAVVNAVTHAVTVFQDNRSLVIATSFTAEDPRLAAEFVNTLTATYIQDRASLRVNANQGANDVMVQRIAQVKAELDGIEQKMRDMRSSSELVGLRAGSVSQQQLEELATAAAKAGVERSQLEANWNRATALSKQGLSDALVSVLGSPTISNMREQVSGASRRVAELSAHYGSDYPAVRSARADLQAAQGQLNGEVQRIVSSLGAQVRVAREQEAQVQKQLADARQVSVKAENQQAQLDQMQREATTRRALYQSLLTSQQQTAGQPAGTETPDVRILSPAVPPGSPSGPNMKIVTGVGGLTGAVLGCLLALLRIRTVDSFESTAEMAQSLGVPVLGVVARSQLRRGRGGLARRVVEAPAAAEAEAMRVMRGQLRFAGRTNAPRSVVFTAITGDETAWGIAAAFARVAAADGERVLLIEGNLQSPGLSTLLGVQTDGLAQALTEGADWRDVVSSDDQTPLDLLLAGRRLTGTQALLSSGAFQNLLVEARQDYTLVVLNAPAVDTPDAAALALRSDATILAVDVKTEHAAAREAIVRLAGVTRASIAVVMMT
jgi:succinoglycan biosynthesis transport protein ExoP